MLGAVTALFILFAEPDHEPVRAGLRRRPGAARPHGPPRAADVPDRRAAGAVGPGRRDAQLVRALRRAGAGAGGVEPGDHRGARRARAGDAGGRRDLRLRDRDPGRHGGAVPAAAAVAARARRAPDIPARLARPARPAGAQADAAGDDRARA